jgi:AraC family transcriptional regulator, transcriptional activator of pobA
MDLRPIAVDRRMHSVAAPRRAQAPTSHASAALAFYTGGRARVQLDGEWEVGEGDVLIVPAGTRHRLLETHAAELWRLTFHVPCLAPSTAALLLEPFERVRDGAAAVACIPSSRHAHLQMLFVELARVGRGRREPGDVVESVERSLVTLVLAEIAETTSASNVPPAGGSSVVARALRVIERRCLGPLGLAEVARAVDRSPAYVTTALTRATGRSAVQWIVAARMAEARRLLLHSDASIEAITGRIGYADPTHFIRMFRREHGVTPAAWRAAQTLSPSHK